MENLIKGIIPLDKPQNMTSFDLVAIAKRSLGIKKIGHLGTLDPMATGLVLLAVGGDARVMEYLDGEMKVYEGKAILGMTSDTQDIWGTTIKDSQGIGSVSEEKIIAAMKKLTGVVEQTPPMYSALKLAGRKLYEYARAGQEADISSKKRRVYVEEFLLTGFDGREFSFKAKVSKGTYVRTLCHDVGEILGCGAVMSELRRTAVGDLSLASAIKPQELENLNPEAVLSADILLKDFGEVRIEGEWERKLFLNGVKMRGDQWKNVSKPRAVSKEFPLELPQYYERAYKVYDSEDEFLGVGITDAEGELKAHKVFKK